MTLDHRPIFCDDAKHCAVSQEPFFAFDKRSVSLAQDAFKTCPNASDGSAAFEISRIGFQINFADAVFAESEAEQQQLRLSIYRRALRRRAVPSAADFNDVRETSPEVPAQVQEPCRANHDVVASPPNAEGNNMASCSIVECSVDVAPRFCKRSWDWREAIACSVGANCGKEPFGIVMAQGAKGHMITNQGAFEMRELVVRHIF